MTFTSPIERSFPPLDVDERQTLAARMDYQRATLLRKLEGLDDEQLRRPMVPSGVSLLGLVKHLTDAQHFWLIRSLGQIDEPSPVASDDKDEGGQDPSFRIEEHDTTDAVVARYLDMCQRSRQVVANAGSLDATVPGPGGAPANLRAILVHMIEETARHNGHADIIRELLDGATGY